MARKVPTDRSLSAEDREYLHSRGQHALVARMDAEYGDSEAEPDEGEELPDYESMTVDALRSEIAGRGLPQPGASAKKADLISALERDDETAV